MLEKRLHLRRFRTHIHRAAPSTGRAVQHGVHLAQRIVLRTRSNVFYRLLPDPADLHPVRDHGSLLLCGLVDRPPLKRKLQLVAVILILHGGLPHKLFLQVQFGLSLCPVGQAFALTNARNGFPHIAAQISDLVHIQGDREKGGILPNVLKQPQILDIRHIGGDLLLLHPRGKANAGLVKRKRHGDLSILAVILRSDRFHSTPRNIPKPVGGQRLLAFLRTGTSKARE